MNASRVFRISAGLVLFVMVFGLAGSPAGAQAPLPPNRRSSLPTEGVGDYGLLSQRQGQVKVVVELLDEPTALVYAAAGGGVSRSAISQARVQLNKIQLAQAAFTQAVMNANIATQELYRTQRVLNGVAMELDSQDVRLVAALPGVKAVHPLVSKTVDHMSSVPLAGALLAWANTTPYQGDGIDIGIIDTGIDYTHKNFGGAGTAAAYQANNPDVIEALSFPTMKVVGGYDFVGNAYDARTSSLPIPDPDPLDCNGHGSHVAGTAAGYGILKSDGSNPAAADYAGYSARSPSEYGSLFKIGPGMAPKANLYALKVFGCAGRTDVTELAIEWAVDPNQDGDLSDHLDVINMSLGSSFGSEIDTTAIASNNAVIAGVVVVAAAGNSGDVTYIAGSPGVAQLAISAANSADAGEMTGGFEVMNTTTPTDLRGVHPAVGASFGPELTTSGLTAGLALAEPVEGCTALTNAASVAGKIALIDRGICPYAVKVQNAQDAGAVGVLVANNSGAVPIAMSATAPATTIPAVMTSQAVGAALKTAIAGGLAVPTVRLTSEYDRSILYLDPSIEDTISASSSRGPRRGDTGLKPDLAAPGDTIFSTAVGSGSGGVSLSGTSMASPHVAGAMAILRQAHPGWTAQQLKALVMNSAAHDVYTSPARMILANPDRIGTGRLDVNAAIKSDLIAYSSDQPGAVNVSYGFQEVVDTVPGLGLDLTTDKNVTIANTSGLAANVNLTFAARYPANSGVTYTLWMGGNLLTNPVTVPAGGNTTVTIRQQIDASLLARLRDPGAAETVSGLPREYLSQSGGYVVVTPTNPDKPVLRVSVYAAHRPAGTRAAVSAAFDLGAADEDTAVLPMSGAVVNRPDDMPLVYVTELLHENPNDPWSTGINNNADLMAVGATSNYIAQGATPSAADESVTIALATYGPWSTPLEVEFQVFIDTDEDGVPDWVGLNTGVHVFTGVIGDLYLSTLCPYPLPSTAADVAALCGFADTLNGDYFGPGNIKLNSNPFNSNVMSLVLSASDLGLSADNSDFYFYVDTYNYNFSGLVDTTPWMYYDIAKPAFDTVDYGTTGLPVWVDDADLSVKYDKTDLYNQGGAQGLLLTHHHNAGSKAEVVRVNQSYAALVWDKYNLPTAMPSQNETIPVRLVNETDSNCTFDLAVAQAPAGWAVTLSTPQQYVPAHSSYQVNTTVKPTGLVPGGAKDITLTATCQQNPAIAAAADLVVLVNMMWFPTISK